jgi:WLM domain
MENGYTSYSVNKGEKIVMCVRQKDNSLVPKNVVMYVGIHELSHIMTSDIGHTPEFWDNFKFLLAKGQSDMMGIAMENPAVTVRLRYSMQCNVYICHLYRPRGYPSRT